MTKEIFIDDYYQYLGEEGVQFDYEIDGILIHQFIPKKEFFTNFKNAQSK
jgi:hypothetical protein